MIFRFLFFTTFSVFLLSGCNSNYPDNEKSELPKVETQKTGLPFGLLMRSVFFSELKRDELLNQRQKFFDSVKLTLDGRTYSKLKFASELNSTSKVLLISDENEHEVILVLPDMSKPDSICQVYFDNANTSIFNCGSSNQSSSGGINLITSQTATNNPVQLEYYEEAYEYLTIIGSTILSTQITPTEVTIKTSFAFEKFYKDIVCKGICPFRVNSSLGVTTYFQMKAIVNQNKGSKMTVVFDNHIGGSVDDAINMYTGLLIHDNEVNTLVSKNGSVFSGGTDLFSAGIERTLERAIEHGGIEQAKQIGIHSWYDSESDKTAKEIPYSNESHRKQATYFNEIMGKQGVPFYLFTLDSAPAEGEYWISKEKSDKYGLITKITTDN